MVSARVQERVMKAVIQFSIVALAAWSLASCSTMNTNPGGAPTPSPVVYPENDSAGGNPVTLGNASKVMGATYQALSIANLVRVLGIAH